MEMIFEPVILRVIKLVQEQITPGNGTIAVIMLVGGFSQSLYLRDKIRSVFQGHTQNRISVIQPNHAWQAVIRGALRKGLSLYAPERTAHVYIKARRARKHYGHEVASEYRDDRHSSISNRKWWDSYTGVWRVHTLAWFIKRVGCEGLVCSNWADLLQGDAVSEDDTFYKRFSMTKAVEEGRPNSIRTEIYVDNQSVEAPLLRSNQNVNLLCVLEADLSRIPEEELDRERGRDGQMYYVLEFLIESICTLKTSARVYWCRNTDPS